jgi:hypothetical protein
MQNRSVGCVVSHVSKNGRHGAPGIVVEAGSERLVGEGCGLPCLQKRETWDARDRPLEAAGGTTRASHALISDCCDPEADSPDEITRDGNPEEGGREGAEGLGGSAAESVRRDLHERDGEITSHQGTEDEGGTEQEPAWHRTASEHWDPSREPSTPAMNQCKGQDHASQQEACLEDKRLDNEAGSADMPGKVAEGKEVLSRQPDQAADDGSVRRPQGPSGRLFSLDGNAGTAAEQAVTAPASAEGNSTCTDEDTLKEAA